MSAVTKHWWFRRAWFFKQTYGQLIVGTAAMIITVFWVVYADEISFRWVIGLYLGFKIFDHFADAVRGDDEAR